jgi:DNA-binding response OmpR family regulator
MRLLVGESDPALGLYLQRSFEAERYSVDLSRSGEETQTKARAAEYDLAILDLNLSKPDGITVLQTIRAERQNLPMLVLTTKADDPPRVQVLDLGADDFVMKPFAYSELSARVRALLRRGGRTGDALLRVDDLELNRVEHSVKRANRTIELTPKEFSLLEYLMRNAGQHVTRAQIIEHVWNLSYDTQAVIEFHHTPDVAPAQSALVALVHLADLLCRLRGMGYGYDELQEFDFRESPAWAVLHKTTPHLENFDVARFTMELDAEAEEIRELVASAFQHS